MRGRSQLMTRVVLGYIALSMLAAWLAWHGWLPVTSDWIYALPVIAALSHGGGGEPAIAAYFMFMICLLPFTIMIETWFYPVEKIDVNTWTYTRVLTALLILLLFECLLAWFMFFLPDRHHAGTRMKVFIYLSSTSPTGLGTIYGLIYSMFTTIASMMLITVFHIAPRVDPQKYHG